VKINKRKKEIKLNEKKKKKILTFLFQKQDLGYCCQPFPSFPLSIELIQSLQLWGGGKGAEFGYEMVQSLSSIYIYMVGFLGSLVRQAKEGLWGQRTSHKTKWNKTRRLRKIWIEGFFHRTLTKTAIKSSPTSSVFALYETNWNKRRRLRKIQIERQS